MVRPVPLRLACSFSDGGKVTMEFERNRHGRMLLGLAATSAGSAALLVGLGSGLPAEAGTGSASPACSNGMLQGGYGITALGTGLGLDMGVAETMVFDGAGRFYGHGTAVFSKPASAIRFEVQDGTYTLGKDCTGTMQWYGNLPGLEPINHFHTADVVVMDAGRQLTFVYTSTTFRNAPPGPFIQSTAWGHRM